MTIDLTDIKVENYSSRRPSDAASPLRVSSAGVPIPVLLALGVVLAAFMVVAVALSQVAGAC